ncbi:Molybdopterin-guanine dinucleotide biosynthesis protein MobB [hydrothermal vent metagenome]|uniref:Molybdopterin-guanine dinucleotide biosynthesis protein MobB n=1 Tax=hydrothermal vent metagenome TaxID=652676 RepID=A0A3B1BFI0_9ZZZZ
MIKADKPLLGFAAFSGTGKTTLLTRLLPVLTSCGLRVGMIKHSHHRFEVDIPGKDSYELRKAGAAQMLLTSKHRWALMVDKVAEQEPELQQELERLDQSTLDLILVEGFRHEAFPKIELHRPSLNKPLLCVDDDNIIAIATDGELAQSIDLPQLDINDVQGVADFVQSYFSAEI